MKQALTVLIGPTFDVQILTKPCIFGTNFLRPHSRKLSLNLRNLWNDENRQIDHKCEEDRRQSDLHVVVDAPSYFPKFR